MRSFLLEATYYYLEAFIFAFYAVISLISLMALWLFLEDCFHYIKDLFRKIKGGIK